MKKTIRIQEFELPVTLQKDKSGGYFATCRSWKDCYAQGDSIDDVLNEISKVSMRLIELYQEENLKIPLKRKEVTRSSKPSFELKFPVIVSTS